MILRNYRNWVLLGLTCFSVCAGYFALRGNASQKIGSMEDRVLQTAENRPLESESSRTHPEGPNSELPHVQQSQSPERQISEAEFSELARRTLRDLPKIADLQRLSDEEVHRTPSVLMQAGLQLGDVAQAIHDNPALARAGQEFYRACAENVDTASSVRALCLSHLKDPSDQGLVTEEVRAISERL